MGEPKVGDSVLGSGPGMDNRPKVGGESVGLMVEEADAREGARRIEKSRKDFYAKMGMQAPKDGEPDAHIEAGDFLPGEIPVRKPKDQQPKKQERKAQKPLQREEPAEEAEEAPAEEEAAEEAPEGEEEETTEEGVSPESEESGSESEDEEASSDLDAEATVFSRAKVPMSVVKKLSRAESSRLAAILETQQARMDDLGRQLGEARAGKESEGNPPAESGRVTPPEQPARKSLVAPLLGLLGEDAAPALAEIDGSIDARVNSAVELAELRMTQGYIDDMIDDAREALKEKFPELLNDRFLKDTIRPEMSILRQSKLFKPAGVTKRAMIQSLMERAALNARAAKGLSNGRTEKAPAAPARKHGTLSPPKRTPTPPKLQHKDRAQASWDLLQQGKTPEEVKRILDSRM